jgi:membrane fusion protein (multidrug efflux system)
MKRKIIMIISLLVIISLGFFAWSKKPTKNDFKSPKNVVTVSQVRTQDMPTLIRALGSLTAIHSAEVAPEIDGVIESIHFTDGALVKQGDLLIQLQNNTQEARLEQAQAQKKLREIDYNRLKSLQERGAVSKQEFDKSDADLKVADAEVRLAQAQLDQTQIKAPFDGQLGSGLYSVGQYITSGKPLVLIVDKSTLHIDYSVPQRHLEQLKQGAAVTFETPAYPNEKFNGVVHYISPEVDLATRTIAVEASFDNLAGRLSPGLSGTVLQVLNITPNAMIIPEASLIPSITGYIVYRVVDGKAASTPIEIGTRKDGLVQVISGLSPEDRIVVEGHQNLRDGALVEVLETDK